METNNHEQDHDQPHAETDDTVNPTNAAPGGDEGDAGWNNPGGVRWSSANAAATAQAWLSQLQTIIDNLATQSAPVVREVGAKAAEIAALAAERAGPLAQRAADATAQVSVRVAERSRGLAAELRRGPEGAPGGGTGMAGAADSTEFKMSDDPES
jgi:hypothetical protein